MLTLQSWNGETLVLSKAVYEITSWNEPDGKPNRFASPNYPVGTQVRLIAPMGKTPGWHFSKTHRTVCRVDAKTAQFIGVRKENLRKV